MEEFYEAEITKREILDPLYLKKYELVLTFYNAYLGLKEESMRKSLKLFQNISRERLTRFSETKMKVFSKFWPSFEKLYGPKLKEPDLSEALEEKFILFLRAVLKPLYLKVRKLKTKFGVSYSVV